MIRSWRSFCTFIVTALLIGIALLLFVPYARYFPAQVLLREDKPVKGEDAIILFMGDALDRAPHAAYLYKKGYGKKIIFVEPEMTRLMEIGLRPLEGQMVYEYLTKFLKVPEEDIIFNQSTRVTSTQDEAREIFKIIDRLHLKRVILATSWYHSSRANCTFGRFNKMRGIVTTMVPTPIPDQWYENETSFLHVYEEYLKWVFNFVRYGFSF